MKLHTMLYMVLMLAVGAYAMPDWFLDETTFLGWLSWLFVLAFMTPFGWGALILIISLVSKSLVGGIKDVSTTDYSRMSDEEREVKMKQELRDTYKSLQG